MKVVMARATLCHTYGTLWLIDLYSTTSYCARIEKYALYNKLIRIKADRHPI